MVREAVMADEWSQLPRDILELIARRLTNRFDALRFRAVCSSWRSAVSQRPHRLPGRFRIVPNEGFVETNYGFFLSKRTIFRLGSTEAPSNGWLIKVEEDDLQNILLNPLTQVQIRPLPSMLPKVLGLSDFRISELGQEYVLQEINYPAFPYLNFFNAETCFTKKVAFASSKSSISSPEDDNDDFTLLAIHVSGQLSIFKSGDEKWSIIEDLLSSYSDVICFKGKFYAVDITGGTVIVDPSATVSLRTFIVGPYTTAVFEGGKRYLVESEGDLLLVDLRLCRDRLDDPRSNPNFDLYSRIHPRLYERIGSPVEFKVFKLNEGRKKWVELQSLGDRLLFLGDKCSFSASASDFPGCKGNCIIFPNFFTCSTGQSCYGFKYIEVFNLEDGCIGPLASYPCYSNLFWPPPSWVASPTVGTSAQPP
ncbi:F-box protein SKIP23-like [Macadamia integrifolia]|uniref:F-box protein SKIP23-like n=1 Tax=Macadamia integrifolia TaxID=60698 RepID=UPI001C4F3878|nr:F-box protein SKIP23-like [Macadamia integrifolia]